MERRCWIDLRVGAARPRLPLILDAYRRGRLPLDRLISHRLSLDEVGVGIDAVRSGDATRVVLDLGGDA
jgi:alcohol dehydrogenase